MIVAGCTTSGVGSVPGLRRAIGNSLPGTMGKTLADQDRTDDTVAGGCATKVYKPAECDRQTKASAQRRAELK